MSHKYKINTKEYSMPRQEAMSNGPYSHEIPRTIEEFTAGLTRAREARSVDFDCGSVIWAHNSDRSGFIPYYSEAGLDEFTAQELNILGTAPYGGLKKYDKAEVYAERTGALWHVTGEGTGRRLERLQPLFSPFGEEWHDSVVGPSIFPLPRELQKKLGQEERRRSQLRKTVGFVGVLALPPLALAYSGNFYPSATSPAPVASASPTPTAKPKVTKAPPVSQPTPSAEPTTPPPNPAPDSEKVTVSVASWNALYNNSTKKAKAGINTLFNTNGNDIVGMQEAKDLSKTVFSKLACNYDATSCKYDKAMYPGANAGDTSRNQIMWTDRFTFVKGSTMHAASDPDVKNRHFKHQRYINWVRLKDKQTGQDMYFIDTHAPNGIESHGLPNKKHKGSVKAYATYMHNVVKTIKDLQKDGIPIVLVGDSNVNFRADNAKCTTVFFPCRSIDPLMEDMWVLADIDGQNGKLSTQGKSGNRLIDRVYFSETNTVKMMITKAYVGTDKGKMTGGDEGSDHKPVNVVFELEITDKQTGDKKTGSFSLTLDGVKNFRDAAATSNGTLQKGVLYRSGKLEGATKNDIDKIASLLGENGTIIDLRTAAVQAKEPDPKIPNVEQSSLPVDSASSTESYINVFVENAADRAQMGAAIKEFADSKGPTWVHCTAGKDRTGWFTAMVQYINAIGDNEQAAQPQTEAQIEEHVKAQLMREYLRSKSSDTVKAEWIEGAINKAKAAYGGSLEKYIQSGLGVSEETIEKIAAKL
jgi:protein-tyrosine phosphatase